MSDDGGVVCPYDLLGVTRDSTRREVRSAYFALARLAHPDRGGTDAQMRTVHAACEWILARVQAEVPDLEDAEAARTDFGEFLNTCSAYESFSDLFAREHGLPTFEELWRSRTDEHELDGAAHPGGYGAEMDNMPPRDVQDLPPPEDPKFAIETYCEPIALQISQTRSLSPNAPIDDYTFSSMLDFKLAHRGIVVPCEEPQDRDLTDETLAEFMRARRDESESMQRL